MENNEVQNAGTGQPQIIITQSPKNMGLALLLAFLFGPLGLLYSSVKGGIIMLVIGVPIAIITLGFGYLIIDPICIVWAYIATDRYNKKLMSGAISQ